MPSAEAQCADKVLVIRPAAFGANPETAASNSFQAPEPVATRHLVNRAALEEFAGLTRRLQGAGIDAIAADDTPTPVKPDAVFPNNWFSTHADGTVVLYPMMAPSRRPERRPELLEAIAKERQLVISRVVDLSSFEAQGKFLEGTGSLVLDRVNRIVYACLSPRTDRDVLGEFSVQTGCEVIAFRATDNNGLAIYHTNVMLSIGTEFAIVCSECIEDASRARVLSSLRATRASIIEVSRAQMGLFACNLLEVSTAGDERAVLMSSTAARAVRLDEAPPPGVDQVVVVDIPTIERYGGGSLRCMLGEIFLPSAAALK
ncbi:MAG TPA: arginine deiminase-related protein [Steroidobacteraceae bacterium]|nr:arginine deiminase-related protein [Steroidobacteraceae bacterium]